MLIDFSNSGDSVFLPERTKQNGFKAEENSDNYDERYEDMEEDCEEEDIKIDVRELEKLGSIDPKQIADSLCMVLKEETERKEEMKGEKLSMQSYLLVLSFLFSFFLGWGGVTLFTLG